MLVLVLGSALYAVFFALVAMLGWLWQRQKTPEQQHLELLVDSNDERALAYLRAIKGEPFYSKAEDGEFYALI